MKKVTFVVMHMIVMLIILPATFLLIPQHAAAMPDIDNQILQPDNGSQIFQPENSNQILQPEDMVTFIVEVPYGSKGNGLAVHGSNFSAYIFVESFRHGEMNITTYLDLPDVFVLHDPVSESFMLQTEYDGWYRFVDFSVPQDVPCGVYNITATASIDFQGQHTVIERTAVLKVASRDEVAQMIFITDVVMPSDDAGSGDLSRPVNTIVLQETSPATAYCTLSVCVCKTACAQTEGTVGPVGAYYMGYHVFPGTVLLAGPEDCYFHNYQSGCPCTRMAHPQRAVRV